MEKYVTAYTRQEMARMLLQHEEHNAINSDDMMELCDCDECEAVQRLYAMTAVHDSIVKERAKQQKQAEADAELVAMLKALGLIR